MFLYSLPCLIIPSIRNSARRGSDTGSRPKTARAESIPIASFSEIDNLSKFPAFSSDITASSCAGVLKAMLRLASAIQIHHYLFLVHQMVNQNHLVSPFRVSVVNELRLPSRKPCCPFLTVFRCQCTAHQGVGWDIFPILL